MGYIHKTGMPTIFIAGILSLIVAAIGIYYCPLWLMGMLVVVALGFFIFILSFFRNPKRPIPRLDQSLIYAPADGKVVVIEEIEETEYFKDKRIQISVFMSPLNVHVNRASISGIVKFVKHYSGKYMPAWNPKSSTENERCYTVIESNGKEIMLKQIAGALARRIVNHTKQGDSLTQGQEYGFIKFGSRVDIILPLSAKVTCSIDQVVKGNLDVLAEF